MQNDQILPDLFKIEYRKIVSVLYRYFGFDHPEIAEDIASDTFLTAAEMWGLKGFPENPVAWLHTVARNKARDYIRQDTIFTQKISGVLQTRADKGYEIEIDLSDKNINDSQLQMLFAICHPSLPSAAQIGLALRILCGLGIDEIADAFLSNNETINKRLFRAKEKLRREKIKIEFPEKQEIKGRLANVLKTLYLLFNEGYYSSSNDVTLRKELCLEAMRLNYLLVENMMFDLPEVNALLSLMCFHTSRFEARVDKDGDIVRYDEQDKTLWNDGLIKKGRYYLKRSSIGPEVGKYHFEATIAYWHTLKDDSNEKWENILNLYNRLLMVEYSPMAALNRTYAVSKVRGAAEAIAEAKKLQLDNNYLYHVLLGHLYKEFDSPKAVTHFETALKQVKTAGQKKQIRKELDKCKNHDL